MIGEGTKTREKSFMPEMADVLFAAAKGG